MAKATDGCGFSQIATMEFVPSNHHGRFSVNYLNEMALGDMWRAIEW